MVLLGDCAYHNNHEYHSYNIMELRICHILIHKNNYLLINYFYNKLCATKLCFINNVSY